MDKIADIRPPENARPEVPLDAVRDVLQRAGVAEEVAVVGVRGFYAAEFHQVKNQYGVYDDALVVVTPTGVRTFLGNTDPTRVIAERAVLQAGHRYRYTRGIHGITRAKEEQYLAWVQAGGVTIRRFLADGTQGPVLAEQWIGCNIHKGSWTTTGSAACQTLIPEQWADFDSLLVRALRDAQQEKFWYVLVDVAWQGSEVTLGAVAP